MRVARRCFSSLLYSLIQPAALLRAVGPSVLSQPPRGAAVDLLDWSCYLGAISAGDGCESDLTASATISDPALPLLLDELRST